MMLSGTNAIAIAAGSWGLASIILTVTTTMIERRDTVVTGRLNGIEIDAKHRRHIIDNDWLPMVAGVVFFMIIAAIAVALAPSTFENLRAVRSWLWALTAVLLCVALATAYFSKRDYDLMNKLVPKAKKPKAIKAVKETKTDL